MAQVASWPGGSWRSLTAVVLAGGSSNNLSALTEDVPKALVKVCGNALLYHNIRNLALSGFKDIVVVTNSDFGLAIKENVNLALETLKNELGGSGTPNVFVKELSQNDLVVGTADVINCLSTFVDDDFVILPCDLYGLFDFRAFVEAHLSSPRLCTIALLKKNTPEAKKEVFLGGNDFEDWTFKYRVVTTLDESAGSLLGISQHVSLENGEQYEVYKWHLPGHPKTVLNKDMVDVHIYAFSKHVFKIARNPFLVNWSIRLDFLPFLVKMQETPFLLDFLKHGQVKDPLRAPGEAWKFKVSNGDLQSLSKIMYFIGSGDGFKCARVNSIDSLYSVNIQSCFTHRDKSGNKKLKNVVLGTNVKISESSEIKNSVLGNNVCVGDGVKIVDSVVMDGSTIGNKTMLTKSILGYSVSVGEGSNLKNLIVKSGTVVQEGTVLEKDTLPSFIEP